MHWKNYCVGRVMMRMPEERKLTWVDAFDTAEVNRLPPMTEQQFWDGVETVRKRYLAQTHDDVPTRLAHFEKVGTNAAFIFYYDNAETLWGPVLTRFVYLDKDHAYEMNTGSLGTKGQSPTPALFQPYVQLYAPVLERIHPLQADQIPSRDGLCIDGAVVSGETGKNSSVGLISEIAFGTRLVVAYVENNYKVALYSGYEDLKYDEERAAFMLRNKDPDGFNEFTVLRKRDRMLAGLAGQEFVTRTTLNSGHTYYRMMWTIKGALDGGVLKPTIAVHLNTPRSDVDSNGKPYAKLPPEGDLLKLWDYALSTFQWRNGALPGGQNIQVVN